MFRKRDNDPLESESEIDKGAEAKPEAEIAAETAVGETAADETAAEPPTEAESEADAQPQPDVRLRPETPEPTETTATPSYLSQRDSDLPESKPLSAAPKTAAANVSPTASSDPQANKRLIVGQGIRLSGEINSCDRLVVEGEVEVTLNDTLALEITSSGRFTGGCEVEEADISGIYEGDLTVRNTLFVRGSGRITGTIRYGQLELERGGQIAGNISVLGNESVGAGSSDSAKVRSAKAPLFGGGND